MDSEFCNVEAVVTGVVDFWPEILRPHRKKFAVFVCAASFLLGIPMCTQVGVMVFVVMGYARLWIVLSGRRLCLSTDGFLLR